MKLPYPSFSRFLPSRIWQQIFLFLILLVVAPLVILGFSLINTSQEAIKTTVFRDHKEVAVLATGEISQAINGALKTLQATAAILGTLHADPWRQETSIVELSLRNAEFQRISSVSLEGKEVVTSELGTKLVNRSFEEAFKKAKIGQAFISEPRILEYSEPLITIAVPIRNFGEVASVLMAEFSLRGIWDIVDNIRIGQTGRAYLIDTQGRIIAHRDKKLVLKRTDPIYQEVVQDVLKGKVGSIEVFDKSKEGWLVSYAPVKELKWGLVIEQSEEEAYAFSQLMKNQSWFLIFLSLLAAGVFSLALARFMSQPMHRLIEGTRRLAHGDFSQTFRIRRRDEIGRLLFSFNRMKSKLRHAQQVERLSIIGKSATAIAHELKNSLVLVRTFIQLLPKRHKDKKFIKEFSETIPKELDSWNAMLRNMMEFSKDAQIIKTKVDFNALLEDVTSLAKWRLKQKNIRLKLDLHKELPFIMGSEEKLKQVLLNLINNSMEATPDHGTIILSTHFSEAIGAGLSSYIEVKITNSGESISEGRLREIFEPFYTTKEDGFGLGLAISREIIRAHEGVIKVINEADQGVSFIVRIPIIKVEKSHLQGLSNY